MTREYTNVSHIEAALFIKLITIPWPICLGYRPNPSTAFTFKAARSIPARVALNIAIVQLPHNNIQIIYI